MNGEECRAWIDAIGVGNEGVELRCGERTNWKCIMYDLMQDNNIKAAAFVMLFRDPKAQEDYKRAEEELNHWFQGWWYINTDRGREEWNKDRNGEDLEEDAVGEKAR
jgi:hypothetical protein